MAEDKKHRIAPPLQEPKDLSERRFFSEYFVACVVGSIIFPLLLMLMLYLEFYTK